jgi:hypothetical protein
MAAAPISLAARLEFRVAAPILLSSHIEARPNPVDRLDFSR